MARLYAPLAMSPPTRLIWLALGLTLCLVWLLARVPADVAASAKDRLLTGLRVDSGADRPLVLYAYAESATGREDLTFFLRNGLHRRADFVFIFNGDTDATDLIPADLPNVRIVKRENKCFDLGAFGEVLRTDNLWKRYKRFITMNASIRGPFVPQYVDACWTDIFLNRITEKNKLVGLTMNCVPRPHVQSMIWATDDVGMGILLDPTLAHSVSHDDRYGGSENPVGLSPCYTDWFQAVHAEVGTTELIQSQGYGVDVLMASFHGQTDRDAPYCEAAPDAQDHFIPNAYFGGNIHPYDTVFVKANRKLDSTTLDHMTAWHMNMDHRAWDLCGA